MDPSEQGEENENSGVDGESDQDDDAFLFGRHYLGGNDDSGDGDVGAQPAQDDWYTCTNGDHDVRDIMLRLKRPEGNDVVKDYQLRTRIVQTQMGSMTLCRGSRGETLRQSGAITACLSTLEEGYSGLPPPNEAIPKDESMEAVLLATSCWGAIRDLSCHNAGVRSDVRTFSSNGQATNGLQLMALYLAFYNSTSWEELVSREHLSLLTNVIGAMRNVTHSTGENCMELHEHGVTSLLSWRLLHAGPSLPDVSQPWREAAFRAGATLINLAEKCPDCAVECARNVTLLHILIECWGGKACNTMQAPMLHLGLASILKAAKEKLPEEDYTQSWKDILANEEKRKRIAQRREEDRKRHMYKD